LADGTFSGLGNSGIIISNPHAEHIRSQSGDPGSCVIDCGGGAGIQIGPPSIWPANELRLQGFSITNAQNSPVLSARSRSVVCSSMVIRGNRGVVFDGGWPGDSGGRGTFESCTISNNHSTTFLFHSSVFLTDCTVSENSSIYSIFAGGVAILRCLVLRNSSDGSLVGLSDGEYVSSLQIWNSTLFGNDADIFIYGSYNNSVKINENIIASNYYNKPYPLPDYGSLYWAVNRNCIFGNGVSSGSNWHLFQVYGNDNIAEDPLLCSPYMDDFSLCENSPCLETNNGIGLLGLFGVGCGACGPVSTEGLPLGSLKALYR